MSTATGSTISITTGPPSHPTSPTKHLTMYFDLVSPFAYLGYYTLRHAPIFRTTATIATTDPPPGSNKIHKNNLQITYTPIFLGAVMKATNNRPPLQIKNKREYVIRDMRRKAESFGIPIVKAPAVRDVSGGDGDDSVKKGGVGGKDNNGSGETMAELGIVSNFPPNTLEVMRIVVALTMVMKGKGEEGKVLEVVDEWFGEMWARKRDVSKVEVWRGVLWRVLGGGAKANGDVGDNANRGLEEDIERIVELSQKEEVKGALIKNTEEALGRGCFGLPYFVAKNNITGKQDTFFGFDSLGQVAEFLDLEWPSVSHGPEGIPASLHPKKGRSDGENEEEEDEDRRIKMWKRGFKSLL